MITCPRCNGETRMMVKATIVAPSSLMGKFSKSNLRRSDVYLMGVDWDGVDHICNSCNKLVVNGYRNYVDGLKVENVELKKKLEILEQKS